MKRVYIPIGNFFFLSDEKSKSKTFSAIEFNRVVEALDILKDVEVSSSVQSHKLDNYLKIARRNDLFFPGSYPADTTYIDGEYVMTVPRKLELISRYNRSFFAVKSLRSCRFEPSITSAELAAVTGPEIMILRLVVIGENIFEICLSQCLFEFGFPFGQVALSRKRLKLCRCLQADMATVKRIPLGEKGEKVVVEQAVTVSGGHQDFFSKYILIYKNCITSNILE